MNSLIFPWFRILSFKSNRTFLLERVALHKLSLFLQPSLKRNQVLLIPIHSFSHRYHNLHFLPPPHSVLSHIIQHNHCNSNFYLECFFCHAFSVLLNTCIDLYIKGDIVWRKSYNVTYHGVEGRKHTNGCMSRWKRPHCVYYIILRHRFVCAFIVRHITGEKRRKEKEYTLIKLYWWIQCHSIVT